MLAEYFRITGSTMENLKYFLQKYALIKCLQFSDNHMFLFKSNKRERKYFCYLKIFHPHSGLVHRSQQWVVGLCLAVLEANQTCESQTGIGSASKIHNNVKTSAAEKQLPPVAQTQLTALENFHCFSQCYKYTIL